MKVPIDKEVDLVKRPIPTPYPQRLREPQTETKYQEFIELFKKVNIHIPLLDAFKQVPSYTKFLKDPCTYKRRQTIKKSAYLSTQVVTIVQYDMPPKFKDPGTLTVSYYIGDKKINNALLELRSSVNLLHFIVYQRRVLICYLI